MGAEAARDGEAGKPSDSAAKVLILIIIITCKI